MPLFHIHGLAGAMLSSMAAGASIVCTPGFFAPWFFEWLDEMEPTWFTMVPTMHQAILARAAANREIIARRPLRFLRSSSAPRPPSVLAEVERTFHAPVIESYGMTEASHQMASNPLPPGERKPGSVGVPAGPEIAIMDGQGVLLPRGKVGDVVIRGPNVMRGYGNPDANTSAFIDGWFRTGDLGRMDETGYLFLTGGTKEIINRGGEKISPREVEEVLLKHSAVEQAVAFAIPDARLGEEVGSAIVLRGGSTATEMELADFAAQRLADFKVPRRIVFLADIPKSPTGKPRRIGLAEELGLTSAGPAGIASEPPAGKATETQSWLLDLFREVLHISSATAEDDFFDLGGDSILATQLAARIRTTHGIDLRRSASFS
jgi:acyl-CoA synthetase (AMP-forming)/AMP-acid ligase II